jgi:hypothetical protein
MSEPVVATPTVPKSKYWNEDKKKFVITTQLKDEEGNVVGPLQYFEADTLEELLEKKDAAHQNAAVKLYETRKKVKLGVMLEPDKEEQPIQTFEERPLTAEERVKVTNALKDPTTAPEALRVLLEAQFGAPVEDVRAALRQIEIDRHVRRIQYEIDLFTEAHPEYVKCAENKDNLLKYLDKHQLPVTKKNLEIAFNDLLEDELILVRKPKAQEPTPAPAPPVAAAPAPAPTISAQATNPAPAIPSEPTDVRPKQSSSGLGRNDSSVAPGVAAAPKTVGITIRDVNKMSSKEYAERLKDPEFRKQVDSLYAQK